MAELIEKKLVLKDIASWAVGCDPQEAVMVNVESVGMSIEQLPTTTEAEIRNKALNEFAERIIRYIDCGHLCSPTEIRWSDLSVVEMVRKLVQQIKEE